MESRERREEVDHLIKPTFVFSIRNMYKKGDLPLYNGELDESASLNIVSKTLYILYL